MLAAREQIAFIDCAAKLGDEELIATVQRLLRDERKLSARLLVHLAEVDGRQLYLPRAYGSMFEYCVKALHLSEAEAYLRIGAARLCRRFPRVLHMLASGELHLSALKLLAPVLDESNCEELLGAVRFKSKREVELLLAERRPQPSVPSVIRKLPQPRPLQKPVADHPQALLLASPSSTSSNAAGAAAEPPRAQHAERAAAPSIPSSTVGPLGAGRYKVQLTASQRLHDKLRQAQDLMRHELPGGDLDQLIERALDLLIADRMKRRFGQSSKPRKARKAPAAINPQNRHIPNDVRRHVLRRDGTRCTFVSPDGRRCDQRGWLQLDHRQPFGRGGEATVKNIRILCKAHNQWSAERVYGREFMGRRIERARNERVARQQGLERARLVDE